MACPHFAANKIPVVRRFRQYGCSFRLIRVKTTLLSPRHADPSRVSATTAAHLTRPTNCPPVTPVRRLPSLAIMQPQHQALQSSLTWTIQQTPVTKSTDRPNAYK